MTDKTRLYKVSALVSIDGVERDDLIEATSAAQALRFVADRIFTVDIARPKDVARLMGAGVKIETASEETQ